MFGATLFFTFLKTSEKWMRAHFWGTGLIESNVKGHQRVSEIWLDGAQISMQHSAAAFQGGGWNSSSRAEGNILGLFVERWGPAGRWASLWSALTFLSLTQSSSYSIWSSISGSHFKGRGHERMRGKRLVQGENLNVALQKDESTAGWHLPRSSVKHRRRPCWQYIQLRHDPLWPMQYITPQMSHQKGMMSSETSLLFFVPKYWQDCKIRRF